jgi:hypothetical protein
MIFLISFGDMTKRHCVSKFLSQQIKIMASDKDYMKIYFAGAIRAGRDNAA